MKSWALFDNIFYDLRLTRLAFSFRRFPTRLVFFVNDDPGSIPMMLILVTIITRLQGTGPPVGVGLARGEMRKQKYSFVQKNNSRISVVEI